MDKFLPSEMKAENVKTEEEDITIVVEDVPPHMFPDEPMTVKQQESSQKGVKRRASVDSTSVSFKIGGSKKQRKTNFTNSETIALMTERKKSKAMLQGTPSTTITANTNRNVTAQAKKVGEKRNLIADICKKYKDFKSLVKKKAAQFKCRQARSNRQFWTEFIEIYRKHECLWKIKSKDYMDKEKKNVAYKALVEKLKERDSEANIETVKTRIDNMRSVFRKEEKKITASMKSNAHPDEVYTPQSWYYDMLLFLRDQEAPRSSVSNMDEEHLAVLDDNTQVPSVAESENDGDSNNISRPSSSALNSQANSSSISKQSKESTSDSESNALLSLIVKHFTTLHQEDDFDIIGKIVASKLRKMMPDMEVIAEKLIHDILFEATTGMLKPTTKLISP